jgi:hypothetical protein
LTIRVSIEESRAINTDTSLIAKIASVELSITGRTINGETSIALISNIQEFSPFIEPMKYDSAPDIFSSVWKQKTDIGRQNYTSISASGTGQYILIGAYNGFLYLSNDYGGTFKQITQTEEKRWSSVAVSYSGQYQIAGIKDGFIYKSNNYGVTWEARLYDNQRKINSVSVSRNQGSTSDGKVMAVCTSDGEYFGASNDFGVTWINLTTYVSGYKIACVSASWNVTAPNTVGAIFRNQSLNVDYRFYNLNSSVWSSTFVIDSTLLAADKNYISLSRSTNGDLAIVANYGGFLYVTDSAHVNTWASGAFSKLASIGKGNWTKTLMKDNSTVGFAITYEGVIWRLVYNGPSNSWTPTKIITTNTITALTGVEYFNDIRVSTTNSSPTFFFTQYNGFIYKSTGTNSGSVVTYGTLINNIRWTCLSMSSSGQYQLASAGGTSLYLSTNYGQKWFEISNAGFGYWTSVAVSSSGQFQLAGNTGIVGGFTCLKVSYDFGENWNIARDGSNNQIPIYVNSVAVSSDGKYGIAAATNTTTVNGLLITDLYISKNNLMNWIKISKTDVYPIVYVDNTYTSISYDGKYMTVVSNNSINNLFISSDYGVTWTNKTINSSSFTEIHMSNIGIDNGTYQIARTTSQIYVSGNSGATWTNVMSDLSRTWNAIAISGDGQYQIALATGYIHVSTDFGYTWSNRNITELANKVWVSVKISNNGQYISALAENGEMWQSNTSGYVDTLVFNEYLRASTIENKILSTLKKFPFIKQPGVFMTDGSRVNQENAYLYPVFYSISNFTDLFEMSAIDIQDNAFIPNSAANPGYPTAHGQYIKFGKNDQENHWIIYPRYGIVTFADANFSGTIRVNFRNNTNGPICVAPSYNSDTTSSVLVFFDGIPQYRVNDDYDSREFLNLANSYIFSENLLNNYNLDYGSNKLIGQSNAGGTGNYALNGAIQVITEISTETSTEISTETSINPEVETSTFVQILRA